MYIYIYRFIYFASFVVPRGLGTHVTSLERKKKKKKKKKSGNPSSLAARTYPILVAFCVLRYIYVLRVYAWTRACICSRSSLHSANARTRFKVHSRIGSCSGFAPRSLVLRDGCCFSKLPREV